MSNNKIENYTNEELLKRRKLFSAILSFLFLLIVIYGIYMFISMYKDTWGTRNPFMFFPFVVFIILLPIRNVHKKIISEIKHRGIL